MGRRTAHPDGQWVTTVRRRDASLVKHRH
jgi:hypothetical protein